MVLRLQITVFLVAGALNLSGRGIGMRGSIFFQGQIDR